MTSLLADLTILIDWHWLVAAVAAGLWLFPTDTHGPWPVIIAPVTAAAISGEPLIAAVCLAVGLAVFFWRTRHQVDYRLEKIGAAAVAGVSGIGLTVWAAAQGLADRPAWLLTVAAVALAGAAAGAGLSLLRREPPQPLLHAKAYGFSYAIVAGAGVGISLLVSAAGMWVCAVVIVLYALAAGAAQRYVNLARAHQRTVDALSVVTGSSDPYLTGHARRVARYATAAARQLRLSRKELHMLEYAALLHNLGVLEEEWQLSNRPGTLSPDEVEQIRRATLASADIVARFGYYPEAADCIRYHLEPYEQAPNAPRGARILAVANALDAMLVRNRWRRSLTLAEAAEELRKGAGTQFDPTAVEAMLAALHADPALRQLASEPYSILADQPQLGGVRSGATSPAAQAAMTVHNTQLQRLFEQSLRLLAATKSHTELILDSLPDAVFTTDLSGEVTFINRAAARLSGMAAADAAGLPAHEVFGRSSPIGGQDGGNGKGQALSVEEFLRSTLTSYEAEVEWRGRDGHVYPARVQFARLSDDGELVGAVARIEDRSEIRRLQEQVHRAERLAMLGELAASVAHEIRNPLAIVRGYAEQLPHDVGDQAVLEHSVATILREVDRLDRVIGTLLAFARPTSLDARYVELEAELERIAEKLQPQADSQRVEIKRNFSGLPEVFCDAEKLEQVFLNILLNALHAMPDGGTVTIRTQLEPADAGGQQVAIYFTDTGPGIPEDLRQQIFQPFFTTRRRGTGLGLSISARIVEEHGGRLALVGTGPSGTTFGLWLPA